MRILAFVALLGLLLSTAWHIGLVLGHDFLGSAAEDLFVGIFVVWFPTVIHLQKLGPGLQSGGWKALFRGAPAWVSTVVSGTLWYAAVNFILGMAGFYDMSTSFWRMGSGHAMAFYAASWGISYAAIRRDEQGIEWKCQNGHEMSPDAKFCEQCGAPARQQIGLQGGA